MWWELEPNQRLWLKKVGRFSMESPKKIKFHACVAISKLIKCPFDPSVSSYPLIQALALMKMKNQKSKCSTQNTSSPESSIDSQFLCVHRGSRFALVFRSLSVSQSFKLFCLSFTIYWFFALFRCAPWFPVCSVARCYIQQKNIEIHTNIHTCAHTHAYQTRAIVVTLFSCTLCTSLAVHRTWYSV